MIEIDEHSYTFPELRGTTIVPIKPLVSHIHRQLMGTMNAVKSAMDDDEKKQLLADMAVCSAALTLLCLASIESDREFLELSKGLIRNLGL